MRKHVRRIAVAGDIRGDGDRARAWLESLEGLDVDAVVALGDLAPGAGRPEAYPALFKTFGRANLPLFFLPGPNDAPVHEYLREAYNIEIAFPYVRGIHGTFAFGPGFVLFAGMGGRIEDDLQAERDEQNRLRYPAWEVEYRMKMLHDLKDYQRVFAFTTAPEHKGLGENGSEVLAELIKTHRPRVVFTTGPETRKEILGSTAVVAVAPLAEGNYALYDLQTEELDPRKLG